MPNPKAAAATREPAVFGWCMTNQHQDCRAEYEADGRRKICPCSCHQPKE